MLKGRIPGSVEAMKLFVAIIADMLLRLQTKWEREGKGVFFGTHDGSNLAFNKFYDLYFDHLWFYDPIELYASILGFVDDNFLAARTASDLSDMLEDLSLELEAMGMSLQELKLQFMRN